MSKSTLAAGQTNADLVLSSRAVVILTGCSYLCVGLAFSYLDRRFDNFTFESVFWLVWAMAGFGAGALYLGKLGNAGNTHWIVQGMLGFVLALFPGYFMFSLLRWIGLTLMLIQGARAANLRTRRDFHLCLTVIFVVSLMVGTHGNADWTLWFYLGPAWLFAGLALAWDHASTTGISRWVKAGMTVSFILLSLLLAFVIFLFAPRPAVLGFGFLPPGTDTPGLFSQASGPPNGLESKTTGPSTRSGPGSDGASQGAVGGQTERWQQMFRSMRRATSDTHIPQWQRSLMVGLLDWGQALMAAFTGEIQPGDGIGNQTSKPQTWFELSVPWWTIVALVISTLLGYLAWRHRYRLATTIALWSAWWLARWQPMLSMRSAALALKWSLRFCGHPRAAGQSVREHLASAVLLSPLAQRWLGYAVDLYCETRFGGVVATRRRASNMQKAVQGASDILIGAMPELKGGLSGLSDQQVRPVRTSAKV